MEDEREPLGEGVVFVPTSALAETETYTDLGQVTVEGETFTVRTRDEDGSVHYDWISGPNDGYGFSMSGGPGTPDPARHVTAIRDFLAGIDPATGYLSSP